MSEAGATPGPAGSSEIHPVPFSFGIRVYWEDTDAGGVVYHASYVRFLERARTEWLRALGFGQRDLRESEDLVLVVRDMAIDFHKPARLDDELQVSVVLAERRSASLLITQQICRGEQVMVRAKVRVACLVASSFRPRPLPAWLAGGQ
ncbi:MAG: tol-pal system-associated acyl-CoA thioesterase [Arenimonas sp.]|uniref:tol-pal system-associated acyl-CoA thioesterase n=1 Tax=Arenimonas sp. TaxID=1872635 RepID=UPI0025BB8132|nr:tol-pal system-associated acyl-CoA thioesterase [Arenimonas sp.]MBW8366507.1 tol-pal system-associated acyl-CoA thioesterase [Arenimonas sp.]